MRHIYWILLALLLPAFGIIVYILNQSDIHEKIFGEHLLITWLVIGPYLVAILAAMKRKLAREAKERKILKDAKCLEEGKHYEICYFISDKFAVLLEAEIIDDVAVKLIYPPRLFTITFDERYSVMRNNFQKRIYKAMKNKKGDLVLF